VEKVCDFVKAVLFTEYMVKMVVRSFILFSIKRRYLLEQ